ncbi:unnamed protein product [Eruca vesicaria subsp. sativa]|uniref:Kinesin motor domain-containing protein n=1 Tax=Eruca vesicaria subsp. sativa TaxID=29727 RepID=A0ABC8L664_ERUVS|nr:unnamed protein product [Eruca vesicaria subsp. sativa]
MMFFLVPGRVRVAVRLRPSSGEEMIADADFADCVELQPEVKRLKLRKNNWDTDTFEFDEVLTEYASHKRVYEVVAKPVVEAHAGAATPVKLTWFSGDNGFLSGEEHGLVASMVVAHVFSNGKKHELMNND